jgi:hypothetical protein
LSIIVALVEATNSDLLSKADSEDLASIRELALARRLIWIIPSKRQVESTTSTQSSIVE